MIALVIVNGGRVRMDTPVAVAAAAVVAAARYHAARPILRLLLNHHGDLFLHSRASHRHFRISLLDWRHHPSFDRSSSCVLLPLLTFDCSS